MIFLTPSSEGRSHLLPLIFAGMLFALPGVSHAADETNSPMANPGQLSFERSLVATNAAPTNAAAAAPTPAPSPADSSATSSTNAAPTAVQPSITAAPDIVQVAPLPSIIPGAVLGAMLTLVSIGGFLLYQCGLTRAKNSGHACTLLLVGVCFGLLGYWIGGFAVQTGGVGDARAALSIPIEHTEASALDHELGLLLFDHHWGLMGSAGFFLVTDDASRNAVGMLFLVQAAMLAIVIAAALGSTLERSKVLGLAFCSYLIGVLVYPLLANWAWGGGWLAELGREFDLGNGYVDLGGSGVVHETAGVLALVLAIVLGPRHGRFSSSRPAFAIPGHNVPFIVLGSVILLVSWTATNAFIAGSLPADPGSPMPTSNGGLAAINTLLAAVGGLVASFIQATWQKLRPEPARLCRGLLGGAVASCGSAGLVDSWAAFLIGAIAGLLVQEVLQRLERRQIDDPSGGVAVHGAGGVWGVIATGLFANGGGGAGINGVIFPVRGLFFGGGLHQLFAQIIGGLTILAVIASLGYASVNLVQKILGLRVPLADEIKGLDWSEVGALGYQGDVDSEE